MLAYKMFNRPGSFSARLPFTFKEVVILFCQFALVYFLPIMPPTARLDISLPNIHEWLIEDDRAGERHSEVTKGTFTLL